MSTPLLAHVTVDEDAGTAYCAACSIGMTVPQRTFGPVARTDLLASFLTQHSVHTKAGAPSGLTPTGKPTKAARDALAAAVRGR